MNRIAPLFGSTILFALTWAAGHDILSGERDAWMEYTVVIVSLLVAGYRLGVELIRILNKSRNR